MNIVSNTSFLSIIIFCVSYSLIQEVFVEHLLCASVMLSKQMNKRDSPPSRSSWKQIYTGLGGSPVTEEIPDHYRTMEKDHPTGPSLHEAAAGFSTS